ncbi:MAG: hypothetical protein GVY26_20455 [Bacteroidetes bacterium]|jgi:Uma2 family endonuclease|nr:hypothetical protein [Bacteroidota bacterium]
MTTTATIPTSFDERLRTLGPGETLVPANFSDFIACLAECEYRIEYERGNIVLMSIASDEHEQIVANLLYTLVSQLKENPEFKRYGSNRHVFIEALEKAYSPDAAVVKGQPVPFTYSAGKEAYTNPWLVAEVISPSSRNRDFGDKLLGYKAIPSLQYIIYLEQDRPFATLFERLSGSGRWRSTDYDSLSQSLPLGEFALEMKDLYDNLNFEPKVG